MKQLIERAEQLELAEAVAEMTEQQLEALAQTLYEINKEAALTLSKAISFEAMEASLEERHGILM